MIVQTPPTRRSAAQPARPASSSGEQPASAYARSLLTTLDEADERERKLLDEAAELDRREGEPNSDET